MVFLRLLLAFAATPFLVNASKYPCSAIEDNVDYHGNDIRHTRRVSAEYCCDDCAKTDKCQVFTWTDYEGGTCWLKHSKGEKKLAIGAMSGSIKSDPIPDKCSYIEADVDYPGNDIASTRQAHAVSCCDDCAMNRRCHFFTWTNHEGGTCWLKKSKGKKKYFPGAKSGSIESPPKPEPPCPEPSKPEPPKPEPPCPEPPKPEPPKPEPPCPEPPKPEPPKPEPPAPEPPCIIPNVRKV
ncbi:hypothetical protein H310_12338 [Aphanomyces invadans]|uniref:Apple domain-containing protein n=1 Tax=Aphanomyces invadans TaxID=157072 RepID=A0A024TK95_9STRA|nr:hypothetical protein H310_12338 [Aphanomyces invadans]ETV93772.1 hypothetical protein H310_12338 [Aphanomyces invadans]|eukprot:XP_008877581.1 hypothetical protein H310_12338 [Aphanomyces invadans]